MIEFRTTTTPKEAPGLLALIEDLIVRIDPMIVLHTETHRLTVLVRITFPVQHELDAFLEALYEQGVELPRSGVTPKARAEPLSDREAVD